MEPTIEEQQQAVYNAICAVAAHCDGAIADDAVGFNGQDTVFGRRIAAMSYGEWTPDIHAEAARLARRYMVQASNYGHDVGELPIVVNALKETNHVARNEARAHEKREAVKSGREMLVNDNVVIIRWNKKDPEFNIFYKAVKTAGAQWNGREWTISREVVSQQMLNDLLSGGFPIDESLEPVFAEVIAQAPEKPYTGFVKVVGNELSVELNGFQSRDIFNGMRALSGCRWDKKTNINYVAQTAANLTWLTENGFKVPEGVDTGAADRAAAAKAAAQAELNAAFDRRLAASYAESGTMDLTSLCPEGYAPFDYQVAGVEYTIDVRRALIGDEMGLGKTIQAMLTVKALESYPAIVVCLSSLKGNWAKEIRTWDPAKKVVILAGRTPSPEAITEAKSADWVIVNFDIVDGWKEVLIGMTKNALVIDESQRAKNAEGKWTKALFAIAESMPQDAVRLCLTGTPFLNRPNELPAQLHILGQLENFVPENRVKKGYGSMAKAFMWNYCDPQDTGWGFTYNGATNEAELRDKLRGICMVRRERSQVLDLSDTERVQIPLSLNGALDEYRRAERDAIAWVRQNCGDEAARRHARAEALTTMNLLRGLCEKAKVAATIEWVNDWLESYEGKKVVIFSDSREVQRALVDAFDCPHLLGGEKDPEGQKALFMEGDARVMVCSLKASSMGHTLTAASDVVFTTLGWTPGGLQQAEDRCNRIGRTADKVVAWQLHAEGTIDEEIGNLIAGKRAMFDAVIKGTEGAETWCGDEVLDGAIDYLLRKGLPLG